MRKSLSFGLASAFLWFLSSLAPSYAEQVLSQQAADQTASAGLIINVIYDRSVAKAPRGFTAAIAQVVDYFEAHFANPITITINVGYGMIAGGALPADALGASEAVVERVPYATLVS
ncbi:MAG TPA: hypothetical protein VEU06_01045, partial [Micropepsaceae bacterium]|nr:hypothetical protein [Micropepsaceae bacterium]